MGSAARTVSLILAFLLLASAQEPKKCSAPPEYPHTRLDARFSGKLKFGSGEKVYYNCAEDFTPSRGFRAVQCVDGKWTKLTLKCEKKSCGNAGDLLNGEFHYEGNSLIGEKVYATCDKGYTLKGLNYMICKKSGWTGDFPSCEEGEVTCSTPVVANAVSGGGAASVRRVGDNVTFACSEGFQLDGAQEITCGPGGQWQPQPPQCLPSPDMLPDTEGKPCGSAGEITNGQFTYTGVEFGDTATAVCDEGHRLVGHATRRCLSKGWDGRVPACEAVDCEAPPEVRNAEMEGRQETPHTYRSVVRYRCRVGTLHGPKEIWCTEDGTWSAAPPTCKEITCPSPKAPGVFWGGVRKERYQYRDTIITHCYPGYTSTGPNIITCGSDGRWSPRLPSCTRAARRTYWRR
ncbi:C4b-binding protein alpha chain-like isoform X3 [Chaetodon trifascialis]|uniref:C4b-binding protein alpha chain-like isoform X3 n=1 Tax=Chaetodon trifascialis TaxID=109706 RepID=UPI003996B1DF